MNYFKKNIKEKYFLNNFNITLLKMQYFIYKFRYFKVNFNIIVQIIISLFPVK